MSAMERTFIIDSLPESALRYQRGCAIVAVDVIRATTMAVTAVSAGRRCYPVDSLDAVMRLAEKLHEPLLAGELNGEKPPGFHLNNSPAELAKRSDTSRPVILLSSSGTRLIINARGCDALYLACYRNMGSLGRHLAVARWPRVALLGAGSRRDFREEDQICCARIGAQLVQAGYVPEDAQTVDILDRWSNAKPSDCVVSQSVDYLRRTLQLADLRFILERIDDLEETFILQNDEVVMIAPEAPPLLTTLIYE
ncbi:MAG: Phosphosulfolactate phosphohydrolase -like protein [Bryobacterales bacterium]|jgi:2-phosphosulfolactate phosphatase|nr:Phosphosulfolactate phosphohydrolase -like protein [Bryobacterales bacterium]